MLGNIIRHNSAQSLGTSLTLCPWQRQFELLYFLQTIMVPGKHRSQQSLKWTWHEKYFFKTLMLTQRWKKDQYRIQSPHTHSVVYILNFQTINNDNLHFLSFLGLWGGVLPKRKGFGKIHKQFILTRLGACLVFKRKVCVSSTLPKGSVKTFIHPWDTNAHLGCLVILSLAQKTP